MRKFSPRRAAAGGAMIILSSLVVGGSAFAGGANVTGYYTGSPTGLPSGNGNGDGNAYGRPLAGSVGNADIKNPPGQMPDESDGNNGYECDGNSGIALTNPAHTGCTPTTQPPA